MFVEHSPRLAGLLVVTAPWRNKTCILLFFALLLCTYSAFAAQVTLSWNDPNNTPQEVGGYRLYYWQDDWDAPARVAVSPTAIPYTLTGLEAGQTYHFAVTAYDQNGARESPRSNEVRMTIPALAPVASFHATSVTAGPPPLTVKLADTSTGTITSRSWTFGDGHTSTIKNLLHTYTAAGTYTVRLRVRGPYGSDTATHIRYITVSTSQNSPPPPVAAFRATPTSGTAPFRVTFTDLSTGTITSRRWDFGDGHTSAGRNPTHIYTTSVAHTVRLTVTGPGGTRTRTKTDYITVTPPNSTTNLFEFGNVQVRSGWRAVTFRRPFVDPIVVAKPPSNNDGDPALVRIRNVTRRGFEIRIQEWDYLDRVHGQETVGYLVVERGRHALGGNLHIEADSLVTNQTNFVTVPFRQAFSVAPVVLTAVASVNEAAAVTTRVRNVTPSRFQVRMQEQEKNLQSHAAETLTYIAWPPSAGILADSLVFEVRRTPNIINHRFQTLTFFKDFTAIPVFLADLQTTNGGNPTSLRWANKGFFGVDVKVAEEQSADSEMGHMTEVIGYLALAFHDVTTDSDGDGLTNAEEILQYGTDPAVADTDQDGLNDGDEVLFWGTRWKADPDRDGLINLLDPDSNNNGIVDGDEQ